MGENFMTNNENENKPISFQQDALPQIHNQLLDKAKEGGHQNASNGALIGGGLGALVGSFGGPGGAAVGGFIGGLLGSLVGGNYD